MKGIPKIPGLVSDYCSQLNKTNFRKSQLLANGAEKATERSTVAAKNETSKKTVLSSKYHTSKNQPKWITNDRQVLRFFGYFKEKQVDFSEAASSKQTKEKIRKVVLCFYLADSSLSVFEPKVANSGLAQGELIRRSVLKNEQNEEYSPSDFHIGKMLKLRGRNFYLVDCDEATREYYNEALGIKLGKAFSYPNDRSNFDVLRKFKTAAPSGEPLLERSSARKFLENDGKVLRFFCCWHDPHPLYAETRHYALHFFLSDDTMEIREIKKKNMGRENLFCLSRRKIVNEKASTKRHYLDIDFRCGESIFIFGRNFEINDCDEFTKNYYHQKHGITQEAVEKEDNKPTPSVSKPLVNDSDIFGSVRPLQKRKNLLKVSKFDKKVLRFRAKLKTPKCDIDRLRQFVITFYLENDTISVYEPPIKNSGIVGGKFLDRGAYLISPLNDPEPRPFQMSDFYIGALVIFNFMPSMKFNLVEADSNTLKFCESNSEYFPFSDLKKIIGKISSACVNKKWSFRSEFSKYDMHHSGTIKKNEYEEVLANTGLNKIFNCQEMITLRRGFSDGENSVSYRELCDSVSRSSISFFKKDGKCDNDPLSVLREKDLSFRTILCRIDKKSTGLVAYDDFLTMIQFYKIPLSSTSIQSIYNNFSCKSSGLLKYHTFCDELYPCDFSGSVKSEQGTLESQSDHRPPSPAFSTHSRDLTGFDGIDGIDDIQYFNSVTAPQGNHFDTKSTNSSTKRPPSSYSNSSSSNISKNCKAVDATTNKAIVDLLINKFGSRKYELRKALLNKDRDKRGKLGEEAFMASLLTTNADLTDDELYQLADAYFPRPDSKIDYKSFLDLAFRTSAA